MAVAHDAVSHNSATPAADPSWTHTPSGTPRGVVVLVVQDGAGQETVDSATYGGVTMTALTAVGKDTGEVGWVYAFFLGSSVPTGAQTVSTAFSGTALKIGTAWTVTASGDVEVVDEDGVTSGSLDDPSVSLSWAGGGSILTYAAIFSGLGLHTNVTAGANHTKDHGATTTSDSMAAEHRTSVTTSSPDTVGFTTTAADDVVLKAVAIREIAAAAASLVWQPAMTPQTAYLR